MGKKFVLQNDHFAKRIIDHQIEGKPLTLRTNAFNKEVQLVKGSMLEEISLEKHTPGVLNLKCLDNDSVKVMCSDSFLHEVSLFQAEILISVSPVQDRLLVLEDRSWIREAAMIMVGSNVYVDVGDNKPPALGLVKYCGPVPEIGKGIMFGVELTDKPEYGNSDGSLKGHHYFSTRTSNAGLFLAINKLRLLQERKSFNPCSITVRAGSYFENKIGLSASESPVSTPVQSSRLQPIPFEKVCADGDTPPPLRLNDKVVWISDIGPEYGVVKWLGKLPDVGTDWMVGLEFVNPVGSGTGKYNDYQLFEAKQNHASLVPIIGLMKAEDFLGDKLTSNGSASSTPPRPNRKKKSNDFSDTISHTGKSAVQLSQTFSSLPRDLQKKSEYCSNNSQSTVTLSSNNVSPHGTMQRRNAPAASVQIGSHNRSHSASLTGSGFESSTITPLYSTVDKQSKTSAQWEKLPNYSSATEGNHYSNKSGSRSPSQVERARPDDMMLNGSKSGGNSPAMHRLNLALSDLDSVSKNTRIDMVADSGLPSLLSTNNSQSFYHVTPDDCLPRVTSSSNHNPTVNPLYEITNRKSNSLKLGTTRLDDSLSSHKNSMTLSHQTPSVTIPSKKGHSVSNGTAISHISSNNINNNSNQIITNSTDLEVGSVVEVMVNGDPCYGVIRWIGAIPEDQNSNKLVAGIEMEEENPGSTDGTFHGRRYFHCQPRKAFFVRLSQCRKDGRFLESEKRKSAVFGSIDCPSVSGDIPPICNPEKMRQLCGKNRGIQGHHNSCYLDATLFAMFSCTGVFDSLLHRPSRFDDIPEYGEVQRVLKEEIVNPLRANMYVRADRVMKLRTLLDRLSSVSGLMSEEKDPEEFLNSLLNQILKADPFLKLSSSQEAYFYQLFVEKDEKLTLPTVQQLFDQSFLASDIKLREIPNCLLVQMPRFGKQFKMYPRIIPSLYLDITDVIEDSPRQCSVCGQVAEFECKECFGQLGTGLDSTAFCHLCMDKSHSHKKRSKHKCTALTVPSEFRMLKDMVTIPRVYMELFAILCIETSHYVSFVKCGSGPDAPWCFFDSMADRKGEQNGYNIPEVVPFQDLRWWLSDEGTEFLMSTKDDKVLPEIARRLLCDAYMCLYQSPDVLMYR